MKLFKKKRTIDIELACLYHQHFDPAWLTEQNLDAIPTCTSCQLHLVPQSFKQTLVNGIIPANLNLSPAEAMTAACTAVTTIWAHLNLGGTPISVSMEAADDVWPPEAYEEWPHIFQGALIGTVGDGVTLGSSQLGSLTDQVPYLVSIVSNLQWHLVEHADGVSVQLWAKDSMAVLDQANYKAFQDYMALARKALPGQKIWVLLDRLTALLDEDIDGYLNKRLIPLNVTLHTLIDTLLEEEWELEEAEENSSGQPLELDPGVVIDAFGPDNPKRLYMKFSPDIEMHGPFDLEVLVHHADLSEFDLKLRHEYLFKLLVRARDVEEATTLVRTKFFQKFGLTIMGRPGMNWRAGDATGVDWNQFDSIHEHWLYSKIVDATAIPSEELGETAWRSRFT